MAESYLLGELTPEQRDAFEEHYFDCAECAKDVKLGATLVANIQEVLRSDPAFARAGEPVRERPRWFSWLQPAYALAAMVLAVLLYQNLVTIPRLREQAKSDIPQALPPFRLIAAARGPEVPEVRVDATQPFVLYIDIPPGDNAASYILDVQSEGGATQFSAPVSAEAAKKTVPFFVRGSLLRPGKYAVVLRGNRKAGGAPEAGAEIARYPFSVEYK